MIPVIGQQYKTIWGTTHTCMGYADPCYAVNEEGMHDNIDFINELIPFKKEATQPKVE